MFRLVRYYIFKGRENDRCYSQPYCKQKQSLQHIIPIDAPPDVSYLNFFIDGCCCARCQLSTNSHSQENMNDIWKTKCHLFSYIINNFSVFINNFIFCENWVDIWKWNFLFDLIIKLFFCWHFTEKQKFPKEISNVINQPTESINLRKWKCFSFFDFFF